MSLVQQHILTAFRELGQGVTTAMQTQLGDAARLNEHKRRCLQFLADIQQVSFRACLVPYTHESLFSM
jgi:hypothetical protein